MLSVMLVATLFAGTPVNILQVQAKDVWYEDIDVEIPQLPQTYGSGEYVASVHETNVPQIEEQALADGMKGSFAIPSAYHNTLAQLQTLYPQIRSQGNYNTCWAFTGVGLAEFDLITDDKVADKSIDLSELQAAYFTYHSVDDTFGGLLGDEFTLNLENYLTAGGNLDYLSRSLMQWKGLVKETDAPYTRPVNVMSDGLAFKKDVAHLQNVYVLNIHKNPAAVKKEIIKHGAAGIGLEAADKNVYDQMNYYEAEGGMVATYRCAKKKAINHAAMRMLVWKMRPGSWILNRQIITITIISMMVLAMHTRHAHLKKKPMYLQSKGRKISSWRQFLCQCWMMQMFPIRLRFIQIFPAGRGRRAAFWQQKSRGRQVMPESIRFH